MQFPQDPFMIFSVINMQLRDNYASLDALCDDLQADRKDIESRLAESGFVYDAEHNKFR